MKCIKKQTTNFEHAGDGSRVVGNDKEQKSTSFFHGELVWYKTLTPTWLQLRVIEWHAVFPAVKETAQFHMWEKKILKREWKQLKSMCLSN